MKRILSLLLALVCLGGCVQAGERSTEIPEVHSGSLQNQIEPTKEANTLTLEPSEEPAHSLPGSRPEPEPEPEPDKPVDAPQPEPEPAAEVPAEPAPQPDPDEQPDPAAAEAEPDPQLGLADQVEIAQSQAESSAVLFEFHPKGEALAAEAQPAIDVELFETELLRLINEERAANGVQVLGLEENMRWAARIRAPEVLESLSHTRPNNTPYYTVFDEAGFSYNGKWHGENVAMLYFSHGVYDTAGAAAAMYDMLRESAGHYANMLSENFAQVGIGAYVVDDGDLLYVGSAQLFASF